MSPKTFKPGETVPVSSQVEIINRLGKRTGVERTVTKGERFPPTPTAGQSYLIVDRTKHKSGK